MPEKAFSVMKTSSWCRAELGYQTQEVLGSLGRAMENGHCQSNPARLVKRLREHNERTRFLSTDEEKRLRAIIERR